MPSGVIQRRIELAGGLLSGILVNLIKYCTILNQNKIKHCDPVSGFKRLAEIWSYDFHQWFSKLQKTCSLMTVVISPSDYNTKY